MRGRGDIISEGKPGPVGEEIIEEALIGAVEGGMLVEAEEEVVEGLDVRADEKKTGVEAVGPAGIRDGIELVWAVKG